MKNSAFGVVVTLVSVLFLAAGGGYQVVWESELKRPEARKAMKTYIEENCQVQTKLKDLEQAQKDKSWAVTAEVFCHGQ